MSLNNITRISSGGLNVIADEKGNSISFDLTQSFIPMRIKKDGDSVIINLNKKEKDDIYKEVQYKIPFDDIKKLVISVFES